MDREASYRKAVENHFLTNRRQDFLKSYGRRERPRDEFRHVGKGMTMMQAGQHESAIRERAYAIWEEEGRPDGL